MKKTADLHFCFRQEAGSNVHKLYIYDNVSEYGKWNWSTWENEESKTSAKYFVEQLETIPENHTIELHINSCGGSVKEGVAIYNNLKRHKAHKVGYVDGVAYSIAFVILQSCDERIMGIGTSALIHNIWIETWGNAAQLRKEADDLDVLMESNRKIFMERAKGITEEELTAKMEAETYLTPDQCVEFGFCDDVETISSSQEQEPIKEEQVQQALQKTVQQLTIKFEQQQSFKNELKDFVGNGQQIKKMNQQEGQEPLQQNKLQAIFSKIAEGGK